MVPEGGADIETAAGVSKLSGRLLKKHVFGSHSSLIPYTKYIEPQRNSRFLTIKLFGMTTLLEFFNNLKEKGRLKFL